MTTNAPRPNPTAAQLAALNTLARRLIRTTSAETLGLPAEANDRVPAVVMQQTCDGGAFVVTFAETRSGFVLGHDPVDNLDAFLQARSRLQAIGGNT